MLQQFHMIGLFSIHTTVVTELEPLSGVILIQLIQTGNILIWKTWSSYIKKTSKPWPEVPSLPWMPEGIFFPEREKENRAAKKRRRLKRKSPREKINLWSHVPPLFLLLSIVLKTSFDGWGTSLFLSQLEVLFL